MPVALSDPLFVNTITHPAIRRGFLYVMRCDALPCFGVGVQRFGMGLQSPLS